MSNAYLDLTGNIFNSAELSNIAAQYELTNEYLLGKIKEVIALAGDKDLNLYKSPIIQVFDMQGPSDERLIGDHSRWKHMRNALLHAKKNPNVLKVIGSGWDGASIKYIIEEKLGDLIKYAIIEGGAAIKRNNDIIPLYPLGNPEDLYEVEKNIFEEAAKRNLALAVQGNLSKSSNCFYIEANGPERGNLREHFIVKRRGDPTTKDIYYAIDDSEFDTSGFTYADEKIMFEPTIENTEILHFVLNEAYTLQSVRFAEEDGGRISIRRDNEDKIDFKSEYIGRFAESTIPNGWHYTINDDFCMDFTINDGIGLTKEYAANCLGKIAFPKKSNIITANVGENRGDVFHERNSLSFIKKDSDAEKYCIENNISHIIVNDTVEYLLIMAAITDKPIKDKIPTRPARMVDLNMCNI